MPSNKIEYVSIIVCHYSQPDDYGGVRARSQKETRSELLRITMDSLERNTTYPAEIIVIDNGGKDDDSDYLVGLARRGVINTYVRNKNNMYFGWAWNQGKRLATGSHICFTCNDIGFEAGWLEATIKPLLDHPDKDLIASPLITPDKDQPKFYKGTLDGYRLNTSSGSNCMLMSREMADKLGILPTSSTASYKWYHNMWKNNWLMVTPPKNVAVHLAHKGGVDFMQRIEVHKILLDGTDVDYSMMKWNEKIPTGI